MTELLDLAGRIVEGAPSGVEVEAYLTHSRTFEVRAYAGEIDSLSSAEPRGAGVRVVSDGRVGFAYTTDLTEEGLDVVVQAAGDNARHASVDPAAGLATAWAEPPMDISGLWDDAQ